MEFSGVVLLLLLSLSSPFVYSKLLPDEIKEWCDKTYFPESCEEVLTHDKKYANVEIKEKSDFVKLSLQLAFDRAVSASKRVHELGPKTSDEKEKAAWGDCVDLYDKNVVTLKKTVDPKNGCVPVKSNPKCSPSDLRTWFTTVLDNIDACEQGFNDIEKTDNVLPLISDKVLQDLIINALALVSGEE